TEDVLSEMYETQLDPGDGVKQMVSSEVIVEEENQGEELNEEFDITDDRVFFNNQNRLADDAFDARDHRQDSEFEVFWVEEHPTDGRGVIPIDLLYLALDESVSPWAPFTSPHDFKMGSWFIRHEVTSSMITEGFNYGLLQQADNKPISFTSPYTLQKLVD